ncbi:GNAT family N-acetyltransferase [Clostridium tagluense]|uniref:N-acetyltransferase n=1 Tax=Clostridium tagluense TaxID=360422 RepID=A0A401ULX0_9CLOT|nr:GNAT family N-acetyltransferase [Clostridium tagluense]GCD10517.1 N-acetyltransferase [Clostridium tagluense]
MATYIRYANQDDADSLALIYSQSYKVAFKDIVPDNILEDVFSVKKRKEGILRELSEGEPVNVIMYDEAKPLGILTYGKTKDENLDDSFVEIWRIYLLPSFWGTNSGSELMNWAVTELHQKGYKNIILWVLEDNARARKFYEKMGFIHDGATRIINVGKELKDLRYIKCL